MTETTTAPSVEERLVFHSDALVNIHNNSSQWVDVQRFTFPADTDDQAVLGLLINHERYRQSYATPEFYDAEIIHGPYWLEAISVASFSAVSAAAAEALITTWANYGAPVPESDRVVFDQQVYSPIREADGIYQLADLRATAEHDWGSVIGFTGFHEFVAITRSTRCLTLIVASDD